MSHRVEHVKIAFDKSIANLQPDIPAPSNQLTVGRCCCAALILPKFLHVEVRDASFGGMDVINLEGVPPFITKDGSEIRELLAYRNSCVRKQSLAEARVPVRGSTQEHYHAVTEEIYFITSGQGRMRIESEIRDVRAGDAIAIPPGLKHKIWNTGTTPLQLLCCCVPAYEHSDTFITEAEEAK